VKRSIHYENDPSGTVAMLHTFAHVAIPCRHQASRSNCPSTAKHRRIACPSVQQEWIQTVGKSTILNKLLGKNEFATNQVREKSARGRQTTTRRQLVVLESGALFVDTPGMRELGMLGFGQGIAGSYEDIAAIAGHCRFADCSHANEKGCAVLLSVAEGKLTAERYYSYLKLMKESKHFEMNYLEKRKNDKAFGKLVKNYMKSQQKR
jgi:ribosome biogenesis GTPase / thiamine phosphate phosphatase